MCVQGEQDEMVAIVMMYLMTCLGSCNGMYMLLIENQPIRLLAHPRFVDGDLSVLKQDSEFKGQ